MSTSPVRYAKTSDGYNIAYRVTGTGTPLVFIPHQLSDIQMIWQFVPDWMQGLADRFRLIQFDCRGEGLSTRNLPSDLKSSDFDKDLEAVVDDLGLDRFLIWGWAARSHIAIRYAFSHPERVQGLILDLPAVRNAVWPQALFSALPREDWETFLRVMGGGGSESLEVVRQRVQMYRNAMSPEDWDAQAQAHRPSNVEKELEGLRIPALVLHPRDFLRIPASESMNVAALIPNARFLMIDGALSLEGFPYGSPSEGLAAIDEFVAGLPAAGDAPALPANPAGLSDRELEVLRLLAQGKSNPQIAEELFITRNTVQNHVSSILIKLNLQNRAQAAVYARDHGLA